MKKRGVVDKSETDAAASRKMAIELVDPRPCAVGSMKETYEKYPPIGRVLPEMGYSGEQIRDLESTIQRCACNAVVITAPADLRRNIRIDQPTVRDNYDFDVDLHPLIDRFADEICDFLDILCSL
jgi:predicted GTPase